MPEKIKAQVKYSVFEYACFLDRAVLDSSRLLAMTDAMYAALRQWNVQPGDIKNKNPTTALDPAVSFEFANGKYAVNLGRAGFSVAVQWVDWSQAELITQIIEACRAALQRAAGVDTARYQVQIAMQVVPEGKLLSEVAKPLAASLRMEPDAIDLCGLVLYTNNGRVFVVDKSVAHENGIFFRITHTFGPQATITEMTKALADDEAWIGDQYGLEFV